MQEFKTPTVIILFDLKCGFSLSKRPISVDAEIIDQHCYFAQGHRKEAENEFQRSDFVGSILERKTVLTLYVRSSSSGTNRTVTIEELTSRTLSGPSFPGTKAGGRCSFQSSFTVSPAKLSDFNPSLRLIPALASFARSHTKSSSLRPHVFVTRSKTAFFRHLHSELSVSEQYIQRNYIQLLSQFQSKNLGDLRSADDQ